MIALIIALVLFWFGSLAIGVYSMTRPDWKKSCKKCQQRKRRR